MLKLYDVNNKVVLDDISAYIADEEAWLIDKSVSQIHNVADGQIIGYRHRCGDLYVKRDIVDAADIIDVEIVPNSLGY